jgi:hypothetical protein
MVLFAPACQRSSPPVAAAPPTPTFGAIAQPARVLLIPETEGPDGPAIAAAAETLGLLLAHFEEVCDVVPAQHYEAGALARYPIVFYLAGKSDARARPRVAADLGDHQGLAVWVGPGVSALGPEALAEIGLREEQSVDALTDPVTWTIGYDDQVHPERVHTAPLTAAKEGNVLASARSRGTTRPFLCGSDRLWYAAAGPSFARERFWTACVWADALHTILRRPHEGAPRRLLPVLRDVPVWTTPQQVPNAIRPFRAAGIPVAVMAWTSWRDVPLADRPQAVQGLRAAESLGATIVLAADTQLDAREHFRLAWEVGLHPLAWAGPAAEGPEATRNDVFRLRIAPPENSPPYSAGGLLPEPVAVSDTGSISPDDTLRLRQLGVVRDSVALASFGLWAPADPFQAFLRDRASEGWLVADLRDLPARVTDARRVFVTGAADLRIPSEARARRTILGTDWRPVEAATVILSEAQDASAHVTVRLKTPERSTTVVELARKREPRPFVRGVTLDPWAYSQSSVAAKELAQALAERYQRNGVNTVFFYAYNVDEGAAYRSRYSGASVSDWGREDLLAHVLEACHQRGIRVVAWLYSGRDKGIWKKHPEWRERTKDGKAHNPLRLHAAYFLCPRNTEVRDWYAGLLRDLARRYPTLDGVELCEPVVNWFGDQACYCQVCRDEFAGKHPGEPLGEATWREFRAEGLTEFLSQCMKAVSAEGIDTYIMTISDAWSNGAILSPRRQAEESGFDLDAILDGPYPPDWVNFEIIWQQWAALYGTEVFNYDWAEETARRLVRRTDGRSRVVLHVELTDFGSQRMTPAKIAETIDRVELADPYGVECYHSGAIDSKAAWPVLKQAYEELP